MQHVPHLKNAEEQIKTLTDSTKELEQEISVKDQEIEKMKSLAMKKKEKLRTLKKMQKSLKTELLN